MHEKAGELSQSVYKTPVVIPGLGRVPCVFSLFLAGDPEYLAHFPLRLLPPRWRVKILALTAWCTRVKSPCSLDLPTFFGRRGRDGCVSEELCSYEPLMISLSILDVYSFAHHPKKEEEEEKHTWTVVEKWLQYYRGNWNLGKVVQVRIVTLEVLAREIA